MNTPQEAALSAPPINRTDSASDLPGSQSISAPVADNPWSLWEAVLTWAASVLLSLFVPWLLAFPHVASHYPGGHLTNQQLYADKTLVIILISALLPVHALTFIIAWAVVTRFRKVSFTKALGWSWPAGFGIGKSIGLGIFLFLVTRLILLKLGGQETELERILASSRSAALVTAFVAVATAPLVEEVVYRGLLFSALQRVKGSLFAVVVVVSLFAVLHVPQYWPNIGVISSITLLSMVLTMVRARTGRLLPCFVIHLVFNGVQSLLIVFEPYLRRLIDSWQHHAPGLVLINLLIGIHV